MPVDVTDAFRALAKRAAINTGAGRKALDGAILRPVRHLSEFTRAAMDVSQEIRQSRISIEANRRPYIIPGMIGDAERDRMEMEMVSFIKSCSTSVEQLSKTVAAMQERKAQNQLEMSEQAIAHHHGMVLIVSEELKELTLLLDKYRSEHAIQMKTLMQRRQKQQLKQQAKLKTLAPHDAHTARNETQVEGGSSPVQEMLQEENQALYEELSHHASRVQKTEKMMVEISTLNQMLSTQIMGQAEQIEQIYSDSVQASLNLTRGNTHLKKAVHLNRSAQKCMIVFFVLAGVILLFFDRFYS